MRKEDIVQGDNKKRNMLSFIADMLKALIGIVDIILDSKSDCK